MIGPKRAKPTAAERRAAHDAVTERSGRVCEGCGRRRATDRHHRLHGPYGRVDTVDNLLDLCGGPSGLPGGNHSGCHGVAHSVLAGVLFGWSVKGGRNPAEIPVYHRHTDAWTLQGRPIPHATAVEILRAQGVIRDVEIYLEWFEKMRSRWAIESVSRR